MEGAIYATAGGVFTLVLLIAQVMSISTFDTKRFGKCISWVEEFVDVDRSCESKVGKKSAFLLIYPVGCLPFHAFSSKERKIIDKKR